MVIPNSWFGDSLDMRMTRPGDIFKYSQRRPKNVRSLYPENGHCSNDLTFTCNEEDEDAINNVVGITKVEEKLEECCTSQLEGNQVQVASL